MNNSVLVLGLWQVWHSGLQTLCNYIILCSSSDKGSEFKEAQGPKTSRSSDVTHRAPGLELTNKFSGLENN